MTHLLIEALLLQNLVKSRKEAEGLILAGKVLVDDIPITKLGAQVSNESAIRLRDMKKFVSRAGEKLDSALDVLGFHTTSRGFLDIGASTGGFTDALLGRGARFVAAIDVGKGLLHHRLATDARVQVLEQTDFKTLSHTALREDVDAFVADVSFASLDQIVPHAFSILRHFTKNPEGVVLFKPQFELAKVERGLLKKGVLHDQNKSASLIAEFTETLLMQKIQVRSILPSSVTGRRGNQEYLLHLSPLPSE